MTDAGAGTDPGNLGAAAAFTLRPTGAQRTALPVTAAVLTALAALLGVVAGIRHDGGGGKFTIYALLCAALAALVHGGEGHHGLFRRRDDHDR